MTDVTEDTVSGLIASYLRREGINALTQLTVDFPESWGKPDIMLEDGGYFFGEAEWDGKEWEGFGEARDYLQAPNAEGTFLITYPTELKKELSQTRLGKAGESRLSRFESVLSDYNYKVAFLRKDEKTDMTVLEWDEIPRWFRLNIEAKKEPFQDLDWTISVLRQTAEELTKELGDIEEPELFRSILGSSSGTDEQEEAASRAAGYLLVNQITFYRILSSFKDLPEIEAAELKSPQDLNSYFSKVLEIDYSPVFSYPVSSTFSKKSMALLRNAVKSIYALSPERIGHEALGRVFHELIPLSIRKPVAAYYTKHKAGKILAELSIDKSDADVIDPACGSGTLLSHAYNKKRKLTDGFDRKEHKRLVEEEITGIDIMPFAAHLSTINLALEAPEYPTDKVRIGIEDSTKLEPGKSIPPLSRILPEDKKQRQIEDWMGKPAIEEDKVERGAVAMDALPRKEIEFGKADNVIMNPPFTRQETIADFSKEYKDKLEKRFSEANRQGILDRRMSFCSYFLLLADKFLKDSGMIGAVLPASVLRKESDRNLREYLLENYDLNFVIVREDEPNFSEDTNLREILLILKKGKSRKNEVSFVILKDFEEVLISHMKSESENLNANEVTKKPFVEVRKSYQENLDSHNLFRNVALSNYELQEMWEKLESKSKLERFNLLDPAMIRGPEHRGKYSQTSFLDSRRSEFEKKDLWITENISEDVLETSHRHTGDNFEIPKNCLFLNLRRIAGTKYLDVTDFDEFILNSNFSESENFLSTCGLEDASFSDQWYNYLKDRRGYFALNRRFDITAPGTNLLSFYSDGKRVFSKDWWIVRGFEKDDLRILALWFNSSLSLLQILLERAPTRGGWLEISKYIYKELKILDPSSLSEGEKENLNDLFKQMREISFPTLWKQLAMNCKKSDFSQEEIESINEIFEGFKSTLNRDFEPRRKIDKSILSILGVKNKNQILRKLYPGLLKEIATLKRMMS